MEVIIKARETSIKTLVVIGTILYWSRVVVEINLLQIELVSEMSSYI